LAESTSKILTGGRMREETKEKAVIEIHKISFDGIMKAADVELVTGLSRVTIWREERAGRFPARVQLTCNRVGWYGSEIQDWIEKRPRVNHDLCEIKTSEETYEPLQQSNCMRFPAQLKGQEIGKSRK